MTTKKLHKTGGKDDNFDDLLQQFDAAMAEFFERARRGQILLIEVQAEIARRNITRETSGANDGSQN